MNKFKIIIPGFNAAGYVGKCLQSILDQDYPHWKVFIANDASTDNTASIINEFVKKDKRFNSVCNFKNMGALWNCFQYIPQLCDDPEDIICFVDMDDWLATSDALSYLNSVYQTAPGEPGLWLSYGQYFTISNNLIGCGRPLSDTSTYREKENWGTRHLKTVNYSLWN